jgi:hypothetical protein
MGTALLRFSGRAAEPTSLQFDSSAGPRSPLCSTSIFWRSHGVHFASRRFSGGTPALTSLRFDSPSGSRSSLHFASILRRGLYRLHGAHSASLRFRRDHRDHFASLRFSGGAAELTQLTSLRFSVRAAELTSLQFDSPARLRSSLRVASILRWGSVSLRSILRRSHGARFVSFDFAAKSR